jgi:hypothetical protein
MWGQARKEERKKATTSDAVAQCGARGTKRATTSDAVAQCGAGGTKKGPQQATQSRSVGLINEEE